MKLQLTTVPCPQTLEKTHTAWALGKQQTMSPGKEQQQCSAAAMSLQAAAAPIHAARILPSFLSFLQHRASPHQCQVFLPSQPTGCHIWLVVCHPTEQKWPSQRAWVPTAMWGRTASSKDRPSCAGTTMGAGGSPGCPSSLNDAPDQGPALEEGGDAPHLVHQAEKRTLLGCFKCYPVTNPLLTDFHRCDSRLHLNNFLPQMFKLDSFLLCLYWDTWFYLFPGALSWAPPCY